MAKKEQVIDVIKKSLQVTPGSRVKLALITCYDHQKVEDIKEFGFLVGDRVDMRDMAIDEKVSILRKNGELFFCKYYVISRARRKERADKVVNISFQSIRLVWVEQEEKINYTQKISYHDIATLSLEEDKISLSGNREHIKTILDAFIRYSRLNQDQSQLKGSENTTSFLYKGGQRFPNDSHLHRNINLFLFYQALQTYMRATIGRELTKLELLSEVSSFYAGESSSIEFNQQSITNTIYAM